MRNTSMSLCGLAGDWSTPGLRKLDQRDQLCKPTLQASTQGPLTSARISEPPMTRASQSKSQNPRLRPPVPLARASPPSKPESQRLITAGNQGPLLPPGTRHMACKEGGYTVRQVVGGHRRFQGPWRRMREIILAGEP